jgi:uncharacterized protein (DUF608 family)
MLVIIAISITSIKVQQLDTKNNVSTILLTKPACLVATSRRIIIPSMLDQMVTKITAMQIMKKSTTTVHMTEKYSDTAREKRGSKIIAVIGLRKQVRVIRYANTQTQTQAQIKQ